MTETRHAKGIQYLYTCILMVLLVAFMPSTLWAQNKTISGMITDNTNEPLIGASVVVKNTTIGTIADVDGKYTISAPADATLVISFLGFSPREEKINGRDHINVIMTVGENVFDDVVVVGYGTQKKATLTGAVAGVKGDQMLTTKNENPQNMLTGKIAGVRVWQKSAEPGAYSANFDIRAMGAPLVIIDGIPRTVEDFQRMNPSDIDDVSVLKDASAAIYGVRSANGVILVTTKKGTKDGKTSVSYNGSYTFQKPSGMPKLSNAFQTMTLYNEMAKGGLGNDGKNVPPLYGEDQFEAYRNGTKRTTDWNGLVFSNVAPQTQHDVSITGGNDKTQFYIGMGYFFQEGFFKTGDLNYDKYNVRANVTTKIANGLSAEISLSGVSDERNNPFTSTIDIIRNYWGQGVLYPAYADRENTMLNYNGLELERNPVARINSDVSGYRKYQQKQFQSSGTLNYDLGVITPILKGLSAKAMFSFDYQQDNNKLNQKEYYQYYYDEDKDEYNKKLFSESSPNQLRREFFDKQKILTQFLLNYNRTFGEHNVSGLFGYETQKESGDNFYAQRNLAYSSDYILAGVVPDQLGGMKDGEKDLYDYTYASLIGRLNYAYGSRYIAEFQFRRDGSSKFTPENRWGFFPSASAAWRVSEEPFFKSISALSFVDQLKFRASYGVLGLDQSLQYDWAAGYQYPATGDGSDKGYFTGWAPGYIFGDKFITAHAPLALANQDATWATAHTFDVGVDFEGWNGLFGFSIDYFDRRLKDMFVNAKGALPTVVGAKAPRENLNSEKHYGMDLELTHRNKINDITYRVKGIATIARKKNLVAAENGPYGNSYDRWKNDNLTQRFQGVQFGYEGAGRYQSWQDIWQYQTYKENDLLPGDFKYDDWNGDGEISDLDQHPFAFDQTPWLNYSVNFDIAYKSFDLNVLFQGSALGSMEYKEPLYRIWGTNGGGALEQYLDRWHPVDPNADLYDPNTQWVSGYHAYSGRYAKTNSEFNRVSTAYLRLKSVELGYTIPKIKALASMNLRVFANAYNLFTITGVKFVDPEHPDDDNGRMYPLNKTYTVGLSLTF